MVTRQNSLGSRVIKFGHILRLNTQLYLYIHYSHTFFAIWLPIFPKFLLKANFVCNFLAPAVPNSCLPLGMTPEDNQTKLVAVQPSKFSVSCYCLVFCLFLRSSYQGNSANKHQAGNSKSLSYISIYDYELHDLRNCDSNDHTYCSHFGISC